MRRAFAVLTLTLATAVLFSGSSRTVVGQTFITNTPRPADSETNGGTSGDTNGATIEAGSLNLQTNTPQRDQHQHPNAYRYPDGNTRADSDAGGAAVYPDGINSLTGLPYPNEEAMNRRNLLVKVSNAPSIVRPQNGLNQADVVFEYEVEGGWTRFAAIYRTNAPTHVGPIRSGRLVDFQLAPMYEALFAYSGSSEPIMDIALDGEQTPWGYNIFSPQFGDNEDAGFERFPVPGLPFEHTLFLDTNKVWEKAERRGVNMPFRAKGFAFDPEIQPGGETANDIYITWYGEGNARWQYDEETERYVRYTDGIPHMDEEDGEQLWADNLVIIQAVHNNREDLFEPESKSASVEIALWNAETEEERYGQVAYVFRDGQYHQGYWTRKDREMGSALELHFANLEPIKLKPGRTWVSLVRWAQEDLTISEEKVDVMATAEFFTPTPTVDPNE